MKKITQIFIATIVALVTTTLLVVKYESAAPTQTIANKNVWFKTFKISDGITIELEHGSQLQVFGRRKKRTYPANVTCA
jgi:hypothetical protein